MNTVNSLRCPRFIIIVFCLPILVACGRLIIDQKLVVSPPTSTPLALSIQIEIFEAVWKAVDDDYLDPNFNGVSWDNIHEEYRRKIESGLSTQTFYEMMEELINELGDDHSKFYPLYGMASVGNQLVYNTTYGTDGTLQLPVSGHPYTVIVATFKGSPAEEAGLKSRDLILAIDGTPPVDENGKVIISLLQGPIGTNVTFTVQTPGQVERDVKIIYNAIPDPILTVPSEVLSTPEGERIGYILVPEFDVTMDNQIGNALERLSDEPLDGLILDFRANEGGNSDTMSRTLSFFTAGSIGYRISRTEKKLMVVGPLNDIKGSSKIPLVILVGTDTASAAETFAGILQDIRRAYLIGETTAGRVGILNVYDIVDGSLLTLLHESFRPINHPDEDWNGVGITPDQIVNAPFYGAAIEEDLAIQEALKYLDQR